jgi:general L-amino acid transport system substrate-binding protein
MRLRTFASLGALAAATLMLVGAPVAALSSTLEEVRKRGSLNCGVSQGLAGFSDRDANGAWSGFDVDFCKAVAAAVLGDPSKVNYMPLSASDRFDALRNGKIDLLSRNSTWTLEREATMALLFAGITYHDGQGFLVLRRPNVISALELNNTSVCVQAGTTSQSNLADFMRANSLTYKELVFPSLAQVVKALEGGDCDVFTADQSALFAERVNLSNASDALILPDVISKEPLGPVTRADDVQWFNIVRWTNFALINAEELGISTATLAEAKASQKPVVQRFMGQRGNLGKALGLDNEWAVRAVTAVGNYAEVFERNIGSRSRLGIPRGLNHLWSTGGILYAPPLQ